MGILCIFYFTIHNVITTTLFERAREEEGGGRREIRKLLHILGRTRKSLKFIHEIVKSRVFYVAILCMHMNIISLLKSCRCSNNWSSSETVSLISILAAERELLCGLRAVCLLYFSTISQWINIWYFQPNMFAFMSIKKKLCSAVGHFRGY